jgi:hypothetical protein
MSAGKDKQKHLLLLSMVFDLSKYLYIKQQD